MCIYKIHSLKRTDAGGNGLWDGALIWDPWKILRLTMTGRNMKPWMFFSGTKCKDLFIHWPLWMDFRRAYFQTITFTPWVILNYGSVEFDCRTQTWIS